MTIDQALARADDGMARSLANAEAECNGWTDLAFKFLEMFCRQNQSFISEDVSDASKKWGMVQPPTDRAWGSIYRRAQRAGLIEMDGVGRSRRRHASVCPRWKSRIFGMAA